jgi:hypothetical protein
VFLPHRHAGQADVRQEAALVGVDLVFDDELLGLSATHVRLGLIVGDDEFDHTAIDATRLVDPVYGHLGTDERSLATRGSRAR